MRFLAIAAVATAITVNADDDKVRHRVIVTTGDRGRIKDISSEIINDNSTTKAL